MRSRILGKTGKRVSEIGLGCWQLGGEFGPIEDAQSLQVLEAATKENITFLDTADVYGAGRSEGLIGKHLQSQSTKPFITTKVGRDGGLYPDKYNLDALRKNIEGSIARVGGEAFDLVQLHCVPKPVLEDGQIFEDMNILQSEGLFDNWGASVETIEEAEICLEQEALASLQIIFNLFRQDAIESLLPKAKASNVGIIVRLPLASGVLSGKYSADHEFAETDHRNFNKDGQFFSVGETFSGIEFSKAVTLANELKQFVPEGMSLADMSLRWILDQDAVTTIIAGCSRPEQVERNARVSELPALGEELNERLKTFYIENVREHIRSSI